jgi:hypothetical protein
MIAHKDDEVGTGYGMALEAQLFRRHRFRTACAYILEQWLD